MCSVHYGERAIVLINEGGGFTDTLALTSLSVTSSAEGWTALNPECYELLPEL